MSNFSSAQLRELQQIVAAAGTGRVSRTAPGSTFSLDQQRELQRIILAVTTDAAKGRYAGFGNPQVDTYNYPDNCTATFPWTFDFVIPKNFQRWTSVHLSFKLRAFRRYVSATNNPAVSTAGGGSHHHIMMQYVSFAASTPTNKAVYNANGALQCEMWWDGAVPLSDIATYETVADHVHNVTSNVSLTTGIFEDTAPTSVSIKIDGTDYTSTLGGPWTTDTVELDITKVMPTKLGAFHAIQLTPNQNGRITGELRFSYFVDASVNA